MDSQPAPEVIDCIRDIPLYQESFARGHFPVLEKPEIAQGFPENWMTPRLATALDRGEAEFVLSTGTNHARMQLIRPPYFLLKSYYRLWSDHPDLVRTWRAGCRRVSLTTVLATEHVARVNARKRGTPPDPAPGLDDRRLDERTVYLNQRLDPDLWERADVARMVGEIQDERSSHPEGWYHLDCSGYHLAHLVRKAVRWDMWDAFPRPETVITAYEYTPLNVRRFLEDRLGRPVIDLFGSTELGYLYYSDRAGRYHPYLDRMSLELLPITPGSTLFGLIVTSVRNPYMPLVRYRSGDCVRTLDGTPDPAKVARICGREKELLHAPTGLVAQGDLDECVAAASSRVFLYQLRTKGPEDVQLLFTTFDETPLEPSGTSALEKLVGDLTGMRCKAEHRTHIPVGPSGKYAWLVTEPLTRTGER
jgi:phenylacetate-CoA ligase